MTVIVGLGNPGPQYANTPHSVGFETADAIVSAMGAAWEEKRAFKCLWARGTFAGRQVVVVKPQTYMNLSGESVAPVVKYSNATASDLIVVQDDIDLDVGRLRIRKGGSAGGHNGIRNIIERLGTQDFTRVKLGVGKDRSNVIGHVLGKFDPATRKVMDEEVAAAAKVVEAVVANGAERAMNTWNGWKPTEQS